MPDLPTMPLAQRRSPADAAPAPGAAAPRWGGVLDDQALARLGELDQSGKAGLVARVIGTYVKSLDRLLNQWLGARSAADHAGMRHVAHTLKSSSASVGALTLSGLCAEVEARLRDGPLEGLEPRLDALTDEATHILAALRADSPS